MESLVIYQNGEIELGISIKEETIWLTQKQIVELFDSSKANISEHIKAIFDGYELDRGSTVRKFRTVQKEGNREVARDLEHYNLDVIISVGYRVNSIKATKFRQWATSVLKQYITIKVFKDAHDRFMLIDGVELYHIGASLKDLGKKWFAFYNMGKQNLEILGRVK